MDKNNDGSIDYSEFCNLCEEKRRNIDPFNPADSNLVLSDENEIFNRKRHLFDSSQFKEKTINNLLEHKQ
jgi:hypothetical protein